jgi:ParB family chromosome partitioning protein
MSAKRTGLGRGLDALIPGGEAAEGGGVRQLPIADINPNPRQPRTRFDSSELVELAASIQEHGVIQPLIVTQNIIPGEYTLIAGERRLQAARIAGLQTVPVILREATEQQLLEIAIIENVQRADLNPVETAVAYKQLADEFLLSHDDIARKVGKSRVAISNTLRLLKASMSVLQALIDRKITEGHARAILGLAHEAAQDQALKTIVDKGYTVRQAEELIRKLNGKRAAAAPKPGKMPEIKALEDQLRTRLGTRVALTHKEGAGTITIHYYSDEELNALVEQLLES